jgi:hypothetical protein
MVLLGGGAVSYDRGTPVLLDTALAGSPILKVSSKLPLSGWMYLTGLSENIYFVHLVTLHP